MNASPYFRYYAAFVLILLLALMMRVQAHAAALTAQSSKACGSNSPGDYDKFINI